MNKTIRFSLYILFFLIIFVCSPLSDNTYAAYFTYKIELTNPGTALGTGVGRNSS